MSASVASDGIGVRCVEVGARAVGVRAIVGELVSVWCRSSLCFLLAFS